MPLYEVAVIELPTTKEEEDGKQERLVFGPKAVVARDPQSAAIAAILGDGKPAFDPQKAQVMVRPFGLT